MHVPQRIASWAYTLIRQSTVYAFKTLDAIFTLDLTREKDNVCYHKNGHLGEIYYPSFIPQHFHLFGYYTYSYAADIQEIWQFPGSSRFFHASSPRAKCHNILIYFYHGTQEVRLSSIFHQIKLRYHTVP